MANLSPVTILTFTPICRAVAMVALESSRGGSKSGQHAQELPLPLRVRPRHAQGTEAARGEFVDGFLDARALPARHWPPAPRSPAARPCNLEHLAVDGLDGGLGALVHRVEGLKVDHLVALKACSSFSPLSTARSMVSWSSARDARAALRMTCSGAMPSTQNGSPSVSLFWVRVPVLSEQSTSMPASSSMAASRLTIACLVASRRAPDRHGYRQHRGHGHGNRGHRQHQCELQA